MRGTVARRRATVAGQFAADVAGTRDGGAQRALGAACPKRAAPTHGHGPRCHSSCSRPYADAAAGRGIPYALLDGANEGNRPLRNALFGVSGKRAVYPQVFMRTGDAEYTFLGTYDSLHEVNEATEGGNSAAFDALFAGVARVAVSADAPAVRFMDAAAEGANAAMAAASAAASKARFSATASARATPVAADSPVATTPVPAAAPPVEEPPAEAPAPAVAAASSASSSESVAAAAGAAAAPSQAAPSLSPAAAAAGWEMHTDPTGDTYYWHQPTRQSSWVDPGLAVGGGGGDAALPPDAVWVPLHDPRRNNKRYYYNRTTGQSVWRLPPGAVAAQ